jgi:hypothetical protein
MSDTAARERILQAIKKLGPTEAERARKIGFTVRTIDNWEDGLGLRVTVRLIEAGILHVADEPCPCGHPAEPVNA